ncbi:MAG: DNA cytosine methyltransferase [Roseburia sp.]|nr:DNA cytosine methyltransferase [Roseburia sp.]
MVEPQAYRIGAFYSKGMLSSNPEAGIIPVDKACTLDCNGGAPTSQQGGAYIVEPVICLATQQGGAEIRCDDKAPTLTAAAGMSGNNQPVLCMETGQAGAEVLKNLAPTLNCNHEQPIICLMDQGGSVMETLLDKTGTLRAQEHGHQLVILQIAFPEEIANTLRARGQLSHRGDQDNIVLQLFENHQQDSRITGPLEVAPTVAQKFGTGGNNTPIVVCAGFSGRMGAKAGNIGYAEEQAPTLSAERHDATVLCGTVIQGYAVDCRNGTIDPETNGTLQAKPNGGQSLNYNNVVLTTAEDGTVLLDGQPCIILRINVRRLTPMECERLQGYPDGWTDIGPWTDSKGKLHKESSDSARYKALGNSIALPPWRWVLKRICAQYEREATMASLFDGIGGFPLIWEQFNGKGSCRWASEIEEYPIAVTKYHFQEAQA